MMNERIQKLRTYFCKRIVREVLDLIGVMKLSDVVCIADERRQKLEVTTLTDVLKPIILVNEQNLKLLLIVVFWWILLSRCSTFIPIFGETKDIQQL